MARPTKLTTETEAKILALIRAGNYLETACGACGIDSKTLRNWREAGAKGRQPYKAFCEKLFQAECEAETVFVALLNQAATGLKTIKDPRTGKDKQVPVTGDWKAKAFLGERKLARRWGPKVRFEVDTMIEDFLRHLKASVDADTFQRVVDAAQVWRDSSQAGFPTGAATALGGLADELVATDRSRGTFETN